MISKQTQPITQRFLQLCDEVIHEGLAKNKSAFMESVGEYQQNRALMEKGSRAPTLDVIVNACNQYGYSANWLVLGIGEKKLKKSETQPLEGRVTDLEVEVARIKRLLRAKK